MPDYTLVKTLPTVETYMRLRAAAGLSAKSLEAATKGLAGTWYGVDMRTPSEAVAMGRIIGDGGCFFHIVDSAVLPTYQGQKLGKQIMQALMEHLEAEAPPTPFISLLADGKSPQLYQNFGFTMSVRLF